MGARVNQFLRSDALTIVVASGTMDKRHTMSISDGWLAARIAPFFWNASGFLTSMRTRPSEVTTTDKEPKPAFYDPSGQTFLFFRRAARHLEPRRKEKAEDYSAQAKERKSESSKGQTKRKERSAAEGMHGNCIHYGCLVSASSLLVFAQMCAAWRSKCVKVRSSEPSSQASTSNAGEEPPIVSRRLSGVSGAESGRVVRLRKDPLHTLGATDRDRLFHADGQAAARRHVSRPTAFRLYGRLQVGTDEQNLRSFKEQTKPRIQRRLRAKKDRPQAQ